jgi:hypothetical protein
MFGAGCVEIEAPLLVLVLSPPYARFPIWTGILEGASYFWVPVGARVKSQESQTRTHNPLSCLLALSLSAGSLHCEVLKNEGPLFSQFAVRE